MLPNDNSSAGQGLLSHETKGKLPKTILIKLTFNQPYRQSIPDASPFAGHMHNVPLGLEELRDVDHVCIQQRVESLEFFVGNNANNKYKITHPSGKLILYAAEFSSLWQRYLIGKERGFELKIFNAINQEVVHVKRKFKCGLFACCSQKCLEHVDVRAPQEELFGTVVQVWRTCSDMHYGVNDEDGNLLFRVRPPNKMIFFSDWEFQVYDAHDNVIGEIRKKWAGIGQEMFTSADNFGIKFPVQMDVKHKALLITACILLVSGWRDGFNYLEEGD